MKLIPKRPPGPNSRKVRAFAADIRQLRAQGYTFEAIREALAGAGVIVSNSTVQREMARCADAQIADAESNDSTADRSLPFPPAPMPLQPSGPPASEHKLSGRDIAEAFFAAHPTNPLLRAKETP